jgi:23S rRNA (cytidine1920-2'-O)/16S rRNA (cytidine1409-2'-O)-methyltransferase
MRLDQYLADQHFTETRAKAKDLINRGFVSVNGHIQKKASYDVKSNDFINIEKEIQFVSRGGDKLNQFLMDFNIQIKDNVCIDVGASTGGFTHVLLINGAKHVFTYDVGSDQLHETLRKDARVTIHEKTNILDVSLPEHDLMVIDVSFTSVIPILEYVYDDTKDLIVLVKPQFEQQSHYKDVIKDNKTRIHILNQVKKKILHIGYGIIYEKDSNILGKKGNQETLLYLRKKGVHA